MRCMECGRKIGRKEKICPRCLKHPKKPRPEGAKYQPKYKFLGILGALSGMLVGAALFILVDQIGIWSGWCCILLGFCVLMGYRLLGKGMPLTGVILSAILLLVTPFSAYVLSRGINAWQDWLTLIPDLPLWMALKIPFRMAAYVEELQIAMAVEICLLYACTAVGVGAYLLTYWKPIAKHFYKQDT